MADVPKRSSSVLDDAALAISLLTLIPTGRRTIDGRSQTAAWFPLVGLGIGALLFALFGLVPSQVQMRLSLVLATLAVLAEAMLTRFLHFDGLADVADAWWGGMTTRRRLEIMKDSATGAFGATAVMFAGVLQVTALSVLLDSGFLLPVLIAPPIARCAATFAAWFGTPAREGGLGRSVMGRPGTFGVALVILTVAGICAAGMSIAGLVGVGLVIAGVVLALAVPHLTALRMGGVTGDVMGASVLVVETCVLLAGAVLATLL